MFDIVTSVKMLVSPTRENSNILACFSKVLIQGVCDFTSSLQTAQLALKHRKNKGSVTNPGVTRIIVFVGSPCKESTNELTKFGFNTILFCYIKHLRCSFYTVVGKELRKNNIAVDVILLGDSGNGSGMLDKMTSFVEQVCNNGNSRLITVPPGVSISDG